MTQRIQQEFDSLISKDFFAISESETVGETINILRSQKSDFQSKLNYVYVVDKNGKLTGVLQTRDLLLEDPSMEIKLVMKECVASVHEKASMEDIVELFNSNSFLAVPVVNSEHQLAGIILRSHLESRLPRKGKLQLRRLVQNDLIEVEDHGVFEAAIKRLPWLFISVTSGLVCSYILGIFIGKIESIVALILFVPIILGLAGNVGTQSAHVTFRGLEEGKLSVNKVFLVLGKEIIVGAVIGLCACLLAVAIALLWKRYPIEGIALGLSIIAVSFSSGLLGIVLPVTFQALKIRSNRSSGLFLLLICDIVAIILYFLISLSFVSPTLTIS